jgi:peptidoglycan hydrolase CwlO-like protein
MMDLLIDLMTCVNAIGKTANLEERKRRVKLALESVQAIEFDLQKKLRDLENQNPEPHIPF